MAVAAAHLEYLSEQAVVPREASVRARLRMNFIAGTVLFCALVFQLSVRLIIVEQSYLLEKQRKAALRNDLGLRELQLEYDRLTRPEAVALMAKERLELLQPEPQRVRIVERGGGQ